MTATATPSRPRAELATRRPALPYLHVLNVIGGDRDCMAYLAEWHPPGSGLAVVKRWNAVFTGQELPEREIARLVALDHPHLAAVLDVGVDAERRFYSVMEYVPGCGILRAASTDLDDRIVLLLELLDGLEYAHARGVYHLGLRSDTVLVSQSMGVKLVDFAAATPAGVYYASAEALRADTFATATLARDVLDAAGRRASAACSVRARQLAREAAACASSPHGLRELASVLAQASRALRHDV